MKNDSNPELPENSFSSKLQSLRLFSRAERWRIMSLRVSSLTTWYGPWGLLYGIDDDCALWVLLAGKKRAHWCRIILRTQEPIGDFQDVSEALRCAS